MTCAGWRPLQFKPIVQLALAVLYQALPFLGYLPADLAATPPAVPGVAAAHNRRAAHGWLRSAHCRAAAGMDFLGQR